MLLFEFIFSIIFDNSSFAFVISLVSFIFKGRELRTKQLLFSELSSLKFSKLLFIFIFFSLLLYLFSYSLAFKEILLQNKFIFKLLDKYRVLKLLLLV